MDGRVIRMPGVDDIEHQAASDPGDVDEVNPGELEHAVDELIRLARDADALTAFTAVNGALTLKLARLVDRIGTTGDMTVAQTHTCREFRIAFAELHDALHRAAGR